MSEEFNDLVKGQIVSLAVALVGIAGTLLVMVLVLFDFTEPSYSLLAAPIVIVIGVLMFIYNNYKYLKNVADGDLWSF